jgi:hypothetical protein
MAEKRTIELEVKDNVKSLKAQYKEAVVELQRVSAAYGETSQEAIRAAKAAAELKDQIGFTNDLVDSFNPDGKFNALSKSFGGVLDGFQAVEGGLGLIGVESEAVQEAMLRVQSAMAFSQGVQGVLEAKDSFKQLGSNIKDVYLQIFKKNAATTAGAAVDKANVVTTGAQAVASSGLATAQTGVAVSTGVASNAMKLFRIALIATGIGAIVVLVGLLIANFDKVTQAVMWAREKFEKLGTGVKILISVMFPVIGIIYGVVKALEAMGVVDDVKTAKLKKNAEAHTEAVVKSADKRAKAIKKEQTQNDLKAQREIELAKASGKATYEMELSKAKAHLASGRVYLEVQKSKMKAIKAEMDLLLATEDQDSDRYKSLKKRADGVRAIMDETYKDNVDTNHAIKIMEAEHNKEMADQASEAASKGKQNAEQTRKAYIDNLKKQYDDQAKLEEEAENQKLAAMSDGLAKEKALREDAYNDYRDNFLKERIADEQAALDKQFESGKISREEYNKQLEALRVNAESKLTEQERQILINAKELLNKDLLAIDKKYVDDQKKAQDEKDAILLQKMVEADAAAWELEKNNRQSRIDGMEDGRAKELEIIDLAYDSELLALNNQLDAKAISEEDYQKQKVLMEEKYGKQISDTNKKFDDDAKARKEEEIKRNADLAKQGLTLISDLTELFGKKGEKQAKKAFQVKKAASIATALIDTYLSARSAYFSQFLPIADASSPVRGGIAAGIAVASGLAGVAKIASQKFEGGGSASGGGGGGESGGGGGMSGGTQAPSFNVVGNNGLNQLSQLQQQPTQAYVVSGQVTTAQSLDRNRIQNATL